MLTEAAYFCFYVENLFLEQSLIQSMIGMMNKHRKNSGKQQFLKIKRREIQMKISEFVGLVNFSIAVDLKSFKNLAKRSK